MFRWVTAGACPLRRRCPPPLVPFAVQYSLFLLSSQNKHSPKYSLALIETEAKCSWGWQYWSMERHLCMCFCSCCSLCRMLIRNLTSLGTPTFILYFLLWSNIMWRILIIWTKTMHYFLLVYFNNKPLHVSSRLASHHQEDQLCINSNSQHNAWLYQLLYIQCSTSWWWAANFFETCRGLLLK